MLTDNDSPLPAQHPINRSPAERANYLTILGRWARGDIADFGLSGVDRRARLDNSATK
jgi:hypothetical protein